ncbi:MAG: hypothetical protein A2Y25_01805 [Candidatus Melainabacteria bacterium GWF2_37_15]|nr:MAG: hypothetical protein A2Y25_01805 [Candidatus Melainabacteria bacterium GWF2_37_15]
MDIINPQFLRLIFKALENTLPPAKDAKQQGGSVIQPQFLLKPEVTPHTPLQINPQLLLNRIEQAAIMREMLQFPQELKELLVLLQSQHQKINPEIIKQLLETNSKEIIGKLIKLIQQAPNNEQNHEQFKQLLSLINHIVPAKDSSPQEVMTHFLLLYLPWLPLLDQQKIEIRFEKKKSESEEENENVAMVVFISTINLGRFKVTILVDKNRNLDILIQNIENQEREILKNILKAIKSGIKAENINAETQMSVVKQQSFTKSEKREVTISQVNNISPQVLIAAQRIAQIILEFDEKASLLEIREQKINKD